jgi:hypothetical protein
MSFSLEKGQDLINFFLFICKLHNNNHNNNNNDSNPIISHRPTPGYSENQQKRCCTKLYETKQDVGALN